MITLLSTWSFGLALALVALGVFVSYRLFSFPDITTDGSFTLGAVVAAGRRGGASGRAVPRR